MAITPEMIERFKAEYPAARSARAAAQAAGWPEYQAKRAPLVVTALGLPEKHAPSKGPGHGDGLRATEFDQYAALFEPDAAKRVALMSTLVTRYYRAKKAATQ